MNRQRWSMWTSVPLITDNNQQLRTSNRYSQVMTISPEITDIKLSWNQHGSDLWPPCPIHGEKTANSASCKFGEKWDILSKWCWVINGKMSKSDPRCFFRASNTFRLSDWGRGYRDLVDHCISQTLDTNITPGQTTLFPEKVNITLPRTYISQFPNTGVCHNIQRWKNELVWPLWKNSDSPGLFTASTRPGQCKNHRAKYSMLTTDLAFMANRPLTSI